MSEPRGLSLREFYRHDGPITLLQYGGLPARGTSGLMDRVKGDFQDDRAQLVQVIDLLQVEHAGCADREYGGGAAHPSRRGGVGTGQQVDERVQPPAEAREPILPGFHDLHRGLILMREAEPRCRLARSRPGVEPMQSAAHRLQMTATQAWWSRQLPDGLILTSRPS